ncbi:MAG: class I SAM-dependent methyltransferase [Oscillospiraceae bacterium]
MRVSNNWKEFEIIDCSNGEKLERWGDITLARPDPQILWNTPKGKEWNNVTARYIRSQTGGGSWDKPQVMKKEWQIEYNGLKFYIRPTSFKHTGLFPEQATNWDLMADIIKKANRPVNVLNLFAYTGGATLACAKAGANVCHVDASKGMVSWARDNATLSSLADKPIRWIVDDCIKFIEKEIRRGNTYDAIIMDPPSYGRGPGGEVWKLEEQVYTLTSLCAKLLTKDSLFLLLNSYTTGLSASVMEYLLGVTVANEHGGTVSSSEIGLPVKASGYVLPCGSTAIWRGDGI